MTEVVACLRGMCLCVALEFQRIEVAHLKLIATPVDESTFSQKAPTLNGANVTGSFVCYVLSR